MVKQRMPQSVVDSREVDFVDRVEKDNLQSLSLDELANRFEEIEQQGQLLQGKILLEARNRFRSDKEFGQWCATHSICVSSQQQRNRLINLARFFEGRELDKIGISAAYEIAAPINADIALDVYEYAKGKNLPLAEVRKQIAIRKGESLPLPTKLATDITPTIPKAAMDIVRIIPTDKPLIMGKPVEIELEKTKQDLILEILEGLTGGEAKKLLRDCLHLVKW